MAADPPGTLVFAEIAAPPTNLLGPEPVRNLVSLTQRAEANQGGPRLLHGLPFGASVWRAGYDVPPVMKLYQPIWTGDRKTLGNDLSAHLVYGLATAAGVRALSR